MKKSQFLITAFAVCALILGLQLSSCEKYILPELSADPDTLVFTAAGGQQTIDVKSNVSWSIDIIPGYDNWLTCDPYSGKGDTTLVVTAPANTGEAIEKSYTLKSETITRTIYIVQEGI